MRSSRFLMALAIVAVVAAGAYVATTAQTAERAPAEEQPVIDAAMRVDIAPLMKKLDKLEAEVVQLRTAAESVNEKMQAMQDGVSKMEKAIATLKKPAKWQYHFLYQGSSNAAERLGEDGWELVTAGKDNLLIFRRPATEKEE